MPFLGMWSPTGYHNPMTFVGGNVRVVGTFASDGSPYTIRAYLDFFGRQVGNSHCRTVIATEGLADEVPASEGSVSVDETFAMPADACAVGIRFERHTAIRSLQLFYSE